MKYPSKILLFGEHSVIKGSPALAMPLEKFSGTWKWGSVGEMSQQEQVGLYGFADYLETLNQNLATTLNVSEFRHELGKGLYFDSDIPIGYGAGSSGALCAAIFDRYMEKEQRPADPLVLKMILGRIESFFHGSSSGTDPLVSYLGAPVMIEANRDIRILPPLKFDRLGEYSLFLLDTKITRSTGPFVRLFLQKCKESSYLKRVKHTLSPMNSRVIEATLNQEWATVATLFEDIGAFQYRHFLEMIPEKFRELWQASLKSDNFKLKICGAGGGGFFLGISRGVPPESHAVLNRFSTIKISS